MWTRFFKKKEDVNPNDKLITYLRDFNLEIMTFHKEIVNLKARVDEIENNIAKIRALARQKYEKKEEEPKGFYADNPFKIGL